MASIRTLSCSVVLLCVTCSVVTDALNDNKILTSQSDRLKRLAEGVGKKLIVEPLEAELKTIENKARRQLQPKIEQNTQDVGCPAGYTGSDCTTPVCYNSSTINYHDGTANYGDDIEYGVSTTCNDTIFFPLDSFVNDVYISITAPGINLPTGRLVAPNGQKISPSSVLSDSAHLWMVKFGNLVNQAGAGIYSLTISNNRPSICVYSVQAPTTLSCDGGFVSDPRDDNVQTEAPQSNNGIRRSPISGVPSYLAFAVNTNNPYNQAFSVTYFFDGDIPKLFPVNARSGCGASNFVGPFTCSHLDYYHAKIRGADSDGNVWQRVYYFDCQPPPPSKAVDTIGRSANLQPPSQCHNDGVLINAGTADAFCFCKPLFTGNM
uniref:Irg-7 N-terminal galactose binding domain-containing protein n=1 Tax=Plectus sambesii TaxID=2011161 RepID=A0A914UL37_9BILA